jgi:hypothetical protein
LGVTDLRTEGTLLSDQSLVVCQVIKSTGPWLGAI